MNISTVSDEDLSKWIASKLEPDPIWPDQEHQLDVCTYYSAGAMWEGGYGTHGWHQSARDMVNDPAMTVMLLEKMLKTGKAYWLEQREDGFICQRVNADTAQFCGSIGRAVCEAFALANGYEQASTSEEGGDGPASQEMINPGPFER